MSRSVGRESFLIRAINCEEVCKTHHKKARSSLATALGKGHQRAEDAEEVEKDLTVVRALSAIESGKHQPDKLRGKGQEMRLFFRQRRKESVQRFYLSKEVGQAGWSEASSHYFQPLKQKIGQSEMLIEEAFSLPRH